MTPRERMIHEAKQQGLNTDHLEPRLPLQEIMEEISSPAEPDVLMVPDSFGSPESSSVIAAQYDAGTQTLIVDFKGGKRYGYGNIKPAQWVEFYQADSKGGYFNKHIRPLAGGKPL